MGDIRSRFRPVPCRHWATTQLPRGWVDDGDRHLEEAHLPIPVFGLLDGNRLAGESAADVNEIALPLDLAVGAYLAHGRLTGVVRLRKPSGHRPRRGLINTCRRTLTQRLVWSFFIEVSRECRKTTGLGGAIGRRRSHGLEERQMEAFMAAILLRMTRIDALVPDAQFDPPHRESREPSYPGRRKR